MTTKPGEQEIDRQTEIAADQSAAAPLAMPAASPMVPGNAELLLEIYRSFLAGKDLAAGLRRVLEIIGNSTGWCLISAWLPTPDERQIRAFASWHQDNPALAHFVETCRQQPLARAAGMPGRVWNTGIPEWITDLTNPPVERFPLIRFAEQAGLKAILGTPILHEERVIGVLMCGSYQTTAEYYRQVQTVAFIATQLGFALHHKRTEDELRLQQQLIRRSHEELELHVAERTVQLKVANQALQEEILERKRLLAELQVRVRQQEAVAYIGERSLSQVPLPLLLQDVCARVAQTLDVEFSKILELQPDGRSLLLRAGFGFQAELIGKEKVLAGNQSQAGYTLASNKPVVVEDLRSDRRFNPAQMLLDHGVVSGISVVIAGPSRPFGVLGADTTRQRVFGAEDVNFMAAVAHVLSEAIARRRSMRAILKNESWLRNLIATTQDAVVSIDRQSRIVVFNRSAERIFGYPASEIVGHKVNELMAEPYASEHDGYIARYEETGEARAIGRIRTVRAKRKNGEEFPIEVSVTQIEVDENFQYAAFIRDISETVELQARAFENERLATIGGTAARIGHEIANPLNGILLTLQLVENRLGRQPSADQKVVADLDKVKKEIGRLNQLAQEFRNLARKQEYSFRSTYIPTVINEVLDVQKPLCDSRGIVIKRRSAADLPEVNVDEDRLKQALLNLIKNAIEAMPNGGELTVETALEQDDLVIKVSDTGEGILPGTEIFTPFFTTKKDGSGLGLLVVRQIISAHGGTIAYESEPGKGTEFRLILPSSSPDNPDQGAGQH